MENNEQGGRIVKRRVAHVRYTNRSEQHVGEWWKLLTEETSQCNLLVINPNTLDGWYIHGERDEWHVCIKGNVLIAVAEQGAEPTGERYPVTIQTPALVPHAIYNASDSPAWVLIFGTQPHRLGDDDFPLPVYQTDLDKLSTLWENYYGEDV